MTASAAISMMPQQERPISEEFRLIARKWADAESAAELLRGTKKDVLEKLKEKIIAEKDMPDNKAERIARCSPEWAEFKQQMFAANQEARLLGLKLEFIRMRHREWISRDANARIERKL